MSEETRLDFGFDYARDLRGGHRRVEGAIAAIIRSKRSTTSISAAFACALALAFALVAPSALAGPTTAAVGASSPMEGVAEVARTPAVLAPRPREPQASAGASIERGSLLARALATVRSPVAREVAVSVIKPVPHAALEGLSRRVIGSHDAAKRIDQIGDAELAQMSPVELAHLATPALRPNLLQRVTSGQKAQLTSALFRVLDAAATSSPGKLDAVLANMRLTPRAIPPSLKLEQLGATARFRNMVEQNRIERGDLHAFDQRLGDMGMAKGDGSLRVWIDGQAAFGDLHSTMMTALQSAKETGKTGFVLLSTFALHSDQTGRDVAADLVALQSAGFKVHVLYDGVGSKKSDGTWSDPQFYRQLRASGVDLTMVRGSALGMHLSHKKPIQIGYYTASGPKLVEFNGDMNIGDAYRNAWHGSMSRIEGPATKATLSALIDQLKSNGANISAEDEARYRQFGDAQTAKPGMSPIWTINHEGPVDIYNKMTTLSIVDVAPKRGHLFIEMPYVSDPDLFAALERAARDGVNVHLIVPQHNNQPTVALATREAYKQLRDAGVRIYEFHGEKYKDPDGFSHLKRIVVLDEHGEGVISEDGSTNLEAQSLYHNDELVHVLTTAGIADKGLRDQKSQVIKDIARDVFLKDIRSSTIVTAHNDPKPGLSDDLWRLVNRWNVAGRLE